MLGSAWTRPNQVRMRHHAQWRGAECFGAHFDAYLRACPRSCGFCGRCSDLRAQCSEWAAAGSCASNADFMAVTCPLSCNMCAAAYEPDPPHAVALWNGLLMPTTGFGTAGLGAGALDAVGMALKLGVRFLDSAQAPEWYREDLNGQVRMPSSEPWRASLALQCYGCMKILLMVTLVCAAQPAWHQSMWLERRATDALQALAASGVLRDEVFISTKILPRHFGYDATLSAFGTSLRDFHTSYIDLVLLHYAECWGDLCGHDRPQGTWRDSWRALETLVRSGQVLSIGMPTALLDALATN